MEATKPVSLHREEMPAISMGSPFKTHCLADGQLTPPLSPIHNRGSNLNHGPKLQLPRLFKKHKSIKASRSISLPHFLTMPERSSVYEMKAPFPLLVPETLTELNCSPVSMPGLRRVAATHEDLRTIANKHSQLKPSRAITPLLPSPITDENIESSQSYFCFNNPRLRRADGQYSSYDDLHILSDYYDDQKLASMERIAAYEALEGGSSPIDLIYDYDSSASENVPETPKDRFRRGTACSTESDWLANTKSHTERLRRFTARCYQLVQHPRNSSDTREDGDGVMLASVLVGPGKAKLVQISRPASTLSRQTSKTISSSQIPITPINHPQERSAFSPYDTPDDILDSIERAPRKQALFGSGAKPLFSAESLVPDPLRKSGARSVRSIHSSSTAFSTTMQCLNQLADPFAYSPPRQSIPTSRDHTVRRFSLRRRKEGVQPVDNGTIPLSPTVTAALAAQNRKLSRTLNAVTQSINSFPDCMLRLDSPAILELRCPQVKDETYITALRKIFPHANLFLLSALAAWLLVDLYFAKLTPVSAPAAMTELPLQQTYTESEHTSPTRKKVHRRITTSVIAAMSNESLHRIPSRARQMLGITALPSTASSTGPKTPPPSSHKRRKSLRNHFNLNTPCGEEESSVLRNHAALYKRGIVVRQSVTVISQKLMEALRDGHWDEDIWRSLRVLVEIIEDGGREYVVEWV